MAFDSIIIAAELLAKLPPSVGPAILDAIRNDLTAHHRLAETLDQNGPTLWYVFADGTNVVVRAPLVENPPPGRWYAINYVRIEVIGEPPTIKLITDGLQALIDRALQTSAPTPAVS